MASRTEIHSVISRWLGPRDVAAELRVQQETLAHVGGGNRSAAIVGQGVFAWRILAAKYVWHKCERYGFARVQLDQIEDWLQECLLGVGDALETWRDDSAAFTTWAFWHMRTRMRREFRQRVREENNLADLETEMRAMGGSFSGTARLGVAGAVNSFEVFITIFEFNEPPRSLEQGLHMQNVWRMLEGVRNGELVAEWCEGATDQEIADSRGVTRARVQQKRTAALATLQQALKVAPI